MIVEIVTVIEMVVENVIETENIGSVVRIGVGESREIESGGIKIVMEMRR